MYLALYRKYRPRTFDDVISQEHITTTLKNQIINNSAGHAYLFTGSRGTGKTTCAKILSMAVNCDHPENGSPCMKCDHCREILEGTTTDVLEMDAASNRGLEDVRKLREEVSYTPVSCKYRVYIIDEVHMLTNEAFNALLKTLEEPPPHVKFILATTELHKVPATISSRCQRFEFHRINVNDSAKRLMEIAEKEGFSLDEEAAVLISRLSDGGMRDALSVLDRCASNDDHVTVSVVRECAGIADNHHLYEFAEMIAARDTAGCIRLLGDLHDQSKDIALLINNLIELYRDLMIYKSAPQDSDLLFALPDEVGRVAQIAGIYSMAEVMSCLSLLSDCAENIGRTKQRKTLAEMCLIKMCSRGGQTPTEQYTEAAPPVSQVKPAPKPKPAPKAEPAPRVAPTPKAETPPKAEPALKVEEIPNPGQKATVAPPIEVQEAELPPPWEDPIPPAPPAEPMFEPAPPPFEPDFEALTPPPEYYEPYSGAPPVFDPEPEPPAFSPVQDALSGDDYPINTDEDISGSVKLKPFSPVTPEQWKDALSKMDFMMSSMLSDAEIKNVDGRLVITSSNSLLLENVKGDELEDLQKKLSELLGMRLQVKIEPSNAALDTDVSLSTVEAFLKKAQELGITVTRKQ